MLFATQIVNREADGCFGLRLWCGSSSHWTVCCECRRCTADVVNGDGAHAPVVPASVFEAEIEAWTTGFGRPDDGVSFTPWTPFGCISRAVQGYDAGSSRRSNVHESGVAADCEARTGEQRGQNVERQADDDRQVVIENAESFGERFPLRRQRDDHLHPGIGAE